MVSGVISPHTRFYSQLPKQKILILSPKDFTMMALAFIPMQSGDYRIHFSIFIISENGFCHKQKGATYGFWRR